MIRRTGVEVDYRFKLESIDLWETVVITNNKSALRAHPAPMVEPDLGTAESFGRSPALA